MRKIIKGSWVVAAAVAGVISASAVGRSVDVVLADESSGAKKPQIVLADESSGAKKPQITFEA